MRTRHKYTLQYADVDASRHLRLSDLLKYLLEAGGVSAAQMGFSIDNVLKKYNCAWVLIHMTVQMDYLPMYQDEIVIESWVEGNFHMFSIRNYNIYICKDGEEFLVGRAASTWTLLNMTTRQVDTTGFQDDDWHDIVDETKQVFPRISRLSTIDEPTATLQHTIHYSDLDYNHHANNGKYPHWAMDCLPTEITTAQQVTDFYINYNREVRLGDNVQLIRAQAPDGAWYVEGLSDGLQSFICKIIFYHA